MAAIVLIVLFLLHKELELTSFDPTHAAVIGIRSERLNYLLLVLLALSVMSMSYQQWNPWRHPWIYNWMESRGWIDY